jgi:hypothetical protein
MNEIATWLRERVPPDEDLDRAQLAELATRLANLIAAP